VVKATYRDASLVTKESSLQSSAAVQVETPGVRVPAEREVAWRIRAESPGYYSLKVIVDSDAVEKQLWVGNRWGAVSALRTSHLSQAFLHPGEPLLPPSGAIESVEVTYYPLKLSLFGWNVHWLVLFLGGSIVFGFAFKRVLGVEI
jgi:hypothetical protein